MVAVTSVHEQRVRNDAYGTVDFVAENVGVACMAGSVGQAMDDDLEHGHRLIPPQDLAGGAEIERFDRCVGVASHAPIQVDD